MTAFLLDVNVLIALLDPTHTHHDRAHDWFAGPGKVNWLSSPTTQNGTVRIASHPKYSNAQPVPVVLESLESLTRVGNHRFVPDSVSLLDERVVRSHLLSSSQITDTYLVQLAFSVGARLATFDRRIVTNAVLGAEDGVLLIR
ncbi:MAG: VapC toxin family PIN domain ribonuclease [Trueperaceae bacterium]|nr:VapC toxin family PIN domain ribonuclease [Trueperaceae bacterium]